MTPAKRPRVYQLRLHEHEWLAFQARARAEDKGVAEMIRDAVMGGRGAITPASAPQVATDVKLEFQPIEDRGFGNVVSSETYKHGTGEEQTLSKPSSVEDFDEPEYSDADLKFAELWIKGLDSWRKSEGDIDQRGADETFGQAAARQKATPAMRGRAMRWIRDNWERADEIPAGVN